MTTIAIPTPPVPLLHTHEALIRAALRADPAITADTLRDSVMKHAEKTGYMHPGPSGMLDSILSRCTQEDLAAVIEWVRSRSKT